MFDHASIELMSAARKEGYRAVRDAVRDGEDEPAKIRARVEESVREVLKNTIIDPHPVVNEVMALFSMIAGMLAALAAVV